MTRRGRYDRAASPAERAAAQREQILDAAATVLVLEGSLRLTVDRVLARSGLARNTFYAHFSNVPALLAALGPWAVRHSFEPIDRELAGARTPILRLRVLARAWLASTGALGPPGRVVLMALGPSDESSSSPPALAPLADRLTRILELAHRSGVVPAAPIRPRAELVAGAYLAAAWRLPREGREREHVSRQLVDLTLRAFR